MLTFEEKFRSLYPDCRLEEERISDNLTLYHVMVGSIHCSDSGIRDLAFKYALQDLKTGLLKLPPTIEQLRLWPHTPTNV